jgi:hypothetical protein
MELPPNGPNPHLDAQLKRDRDAAERFEAAYHEETVKAFRIASQQARAIELKTPVITRVPTLRQLAERQVNADITQFVPPVLTRTVRATRGRRPGMPDVQSEYVPWLSGVPNAIEDEYYRELAREEPTATDGYGLGGDDIGFFQSMGQSRTTWGYFQ